LEAARNYYKHPRSGCGSKNFEKSSKRFHDWEFGMGQHCFSRCTTRAQKCQSQGECYNRGRVKRPKDGEEHCNEYGTNDFPFHSLQYLMASQHPFNPNYQVLPVFLSNALSIDPVHPHHTSVQASYLKQEHDQPRNP